MSASTSPSGLTYVSSSTTPAIEPSASGRAEVGVLLSAAYPIVEIDVLADPARLGRPDPTVRDG
jgi:hypothetical protein